MKAQLEFERQFGNNFQNALVKLRLILAIMSGFFIFVILGRYLNWLDYTIVASYLGLIFLCSWIKINSLFLRWAVSFFSIIIDLLALGYIFIRTGGISSRFFPMMFMIIFAAAIRYRYLGIAFWSTFGSIILGITGLIVGQDNFNLWLLKSSSLFLMGFSSVFLIKSIFGIKNNGDTETELENSSELQLVQPEAEVVIPQKLTLDKVFSQALKLIREENLTSMAALMLFDNQGQLKIYASFGWEEDWLQHYQKYSLTQKSLVLAPILVFKRPLLGVDVQKHSELVEIFEPMPVLGFFAFPLIFEGEVIGSLVITKSKLKQISVQEEQKLVEIAKQTSHGLEQLAQHKEKEPGGNIDNLTGLYNQSYYDEQLHELIYWAQLREVPLSLILIDIDNFEKYNKQYGYSVGDQLLKKIALILEEVVGKQGIVARCEGEEFALVLWNVDRFSALKYAEIINNNIVKIGYRQQVTVSMGIGNMPQHAKDQVTLIEHTRKALVQAKYSGKNRICDSFSA